MLKITELVVLPSFSLKWFKKLSNFLFIKCRIKQFSHYLKFCANNLSFMLFSFFFFCRSSKIDKNSDELNEVEKQVDRYNDVLRSLHKKISPNTGSSDDAAREKRSKKIHEHMLGQIMEDSTRDLHNGLLRTVLEKCGNRNLYIHLL